MGHIISIDQGTTGTTSLLIDSKSFELVDKITQEFPQIYPSPSWVEHNLHQIWTTVEKTISELISKNNVNTNNIECIGITNQRETTCAFDHDGTPLANAIVWQDRRTSSSCEDLKKRDLEKTIKEKTGLTLDPYFSGTKMNWLLNNNDNVKKAAQKNQLKLGTIDTFLLFKLTKGASFKTEPSNASRTLLMDLKTTSWDKELLDIFGIDESFLPIICDSFHNFGKTKGLDFLPDGIPITGILGDQQAALFGQAGLSKGDIKCTYGTGAFMLLNTGSDIHYSNNGLLSTVAYRQNNKTQYALEGSSYIAGAAVQWLRDNLKIIEKSSDIEDLAKMVKNLDEMEHLLFLPFFTGIGSPHWKAEAKGAIIGLTRDTNQSHIARACLDGIALSINDLIVSMKEDTKIDLKSLKVDGGAVTNELLLEIQATISHLNIIRPKIIETTAYGAALGAAVGHNIIEVEHIKSLWKEDSTFGENKDQRLFYEEKKKTWNKYIQKIFL